MTKKRPPKPHCTCSTCFGILSGRISTSMGLGKIRTTKKD